MNITNLTDYEPRVLLGQGAFGTVTRALSKISNREVALKSYDKSKLLTDPIRLKSLEKEISIMKELDHPGVLKLYDAIDNIQKITLVTDYFKGKSLHQWLRKKPNCTL